MFSLTPLTRNQLAKRNSDFKDFYGLMDNFFNDDYFGPGFLDKADLQGFRNGIDIQENENEYILEVDVPGVRKEDVLVDFKDNQLMIEVNSNQENEEKNDRYIRKERQHKSMKRAFLMDDVQGDALKAKLEDGVLTITAPKMVKTENTYKVEIQ